MRYEQANDFDYDNVEVTSGTNGYPQNLQAALVGFETFSEAQEFAKENGFEVVKLHRREGWQLWESKGWISEPMSPDSSWYGDNYSCYEVMSESDFFSEFVEPRLNDFKSLEELTEFVNKQNELWDIFCLLGDDELIVTEEGRYYETIDKHPMRWSHDTHHYRVAVM